MRPTTRRLLRELDFTGCLLLHLAVSLLDLSFKVGADKEPEEGLEHR